MLRNLSSPDIPPPFQGEKAAAALAGSECGGRILGRTPRGRAPCWNTGGTINTRFNPCTCGI